MGELVDGEYQKLVVSSGAYVREHFFGSDPRLLQLVEPLPDEALRRLRLGGHDPRKVMRLTRRRRTTRVHRRSFWRGRSRATGWAKRAKARTLRTSRKNSTKTSCVNSARGLAFR